VSLKFYNFEVECTRMYTGTFPEIANSGGRKKKVSHSQFYHEICSGMKNEIKKEKSRKNVVIARVIIRVSTLKYY
jgi:hypothetical protein